MKYVNTKMGQIKILEPSKSVLKEIQSILPFGFFPFKESLNGYKFGFVIKCDSEELKCIKQQPVEVEEKVAQKLILLHQILTLETYLQIKDKIGDSLYYATPYLKNKGNIGYETGIAHFLYPQKMAHEIGNDAYERIFGEGATDLFMIFAKAYKGINKTNGLNLQYIGLDIRTRAQLGSLISGFMVYKGNFIYNGIQIQNGDPRFELLANRGIFEVIHMPSAPMEIRQDQFAFAKGKE
jgi:hypothetical protein